MSTFVLNAGKTEPPPKKDVALFFDGFCAYDVHKLHTLTSQNTTYRVGKDQLEKNLYMPVWSSEDVFVSAGGTHIHQYNGVDTWRLDAIKPCEVVITPDSTPCTRHHFKRIVSADVHYPILINVAMDGTLCIVDGYHRLAKVCFFTQLQSIPVRFVTKAQMLKARYEFRGFTSESNT